MYRNSFAVLANVLNNLFGLPGIIILSLLAGAAMGVMFGRMERARLPSVETKMSMNLAAQPLLTLESPNRLPNRQMSQLLNGQPLKGYDRAPKPRQTCPPPASG